MPSPITHIAAGYAIYLMARRQWPQYSKGPGINRMAGIAGLAVVGSLLPDLDAIPGIILGDFGRYHNNLSHSLTVGVAVALIAFAGVASMQNTRKMALRLSGIVLVAYQVHILLDFFTVGRGIMLLWPFSGARFMSPIPIFSGLHWSEGLLSSSHLATAAGEMMIIGAVGLLVLGSRRWTGSRRQESEQ